MTEKHTDCEKRIADLEADVERLNKVILALVGQTRCAFSLDENGKVVVINAPTLAHYAAFGGQLSIPNPLSL